MKEKRSVGSTISTEDKAPILHLLSFIESFISEAKEGKHLNLATGKPVTDVTIRTYDQTFKSLTAFAKHKRKQYTFEDINTSFHKEFIYFMTHDFISPETEKHLNVNTAGKHISNLKTFMKIAFEKKITSNVDFRMRSFKVIKKDVDKIYLTEKEIEALANHDFSQNKRLEKARDTFIIGCHTALRISDLKRLSEYHIIRHGDDKYIEMKKTVKPVTIPVSSKVEELMNKYLTATSK